MLRAPKVVGQGGLPVWSQGGVDSLSNEQEVIFSQGISGWVLVLNVLRTRNVGRLLMNRLRIGSGAEQRKYVVSAIK